MNSYMSKLMGILGKLNLPKDKLPNGNTLRFPDSDTIKWLRINIKNNTLPDTVNKEYIDEFFSVYEEFPVYYKCLLSRPGEESVHGNLPEDLITKLRAGRVFYTSAKLENDVCILMRRVTPVYEETSELFAYRIKNALTNIQMLLIKTEYFYSNYGSVDEVYTVSFRIQAPLDKV